MTQQQTLFYQLGVRESFEMKENLILFNDLDPDVTMPLKVSNNAFFYDYSKLFHA